MEKRIKNLDQLWSGLSLKYIYMKIGDRYIMTPDYRFTRDDNGKPVLRHRWYDPEKEEWQHEDLKTIKEINQELKFHELYFGD